MIKTYLKCYGYLFGLILVFSIILSIINYFIPLTTTFKTIIPIISIFISSIVLGKNIKEKAYIEALKFSILYIIITSVIKLILKTSFSFNTIIVYLIIILTSIIGSTLGINFKKGS